MNKRREQEMVSEELVFIPAPGVGHIISTVEIAKLLVKRDQRLSITVLIMKFPFDTGITTYIESLNQISIERMRFIDLPRDESLPKPKFPMLMMHDFIDSETKYVREIVADMATRPGWGQLAGFVIDMFCTPMIDVANEFEVPKYVYFTSGAAFLGFKLYIQSQIDDHNMDVTEYNNNSDRTELAVPSFINSVPAKVFPSVLLSAEWSGFVISTARRLREVKGIIVNSFLELETHGIKSLSDSNIPPVFPVGPIINLNVDNHESYDNIMQWLDDQPPSSVVFLCFGSMGSFDEVQVREIAHGLESSRQRFVWSLRRPPPKEGMMKFPGEYENPGEVLPEGFLERTAGIGKIIGWAPQVAMLSHNAVGGFVSHCGWNSVLESLWCGVPMATWPMYAEQQLNAFEMVVELGLAVEIKLDYKKDLFATDGTTIIVSSEEIERGVRQLMDGENEIRKKVQEISEKSRTTIMKGGSSYNSLGRLIDDIITDKKDFLKRHH